MPRVIEKTLYKFYELSEAAKKKALQKLWDINVDYDWWEFSYDDAKQIGIIIKGFDLDRGRSIEIEFDDCEKNVCNNIIEQHGEECDTYKLAKQYLYERDALDVAIKLVGDDEEKVEEIDGSIEKLNDSFKKDLAECYWKMLRQDYEYRMTDEAVKETIESNEYEFEEDGSRF